MLTELTHWHWLVLAAVLLIAEVAVSGGFLLWIGIAAALVSIIVWIFPALFWSYQLILFSLLAIISCVAWWAYLRCHPIHTDDPRLNRRSEQYVGRTFVLVEPIVNGRGKIRVDDTLWTVSGADLPAGTTVKIVQSSGTILVAEAVGE